MANEDQANKAREQNSRDLLKRGVHAVGVEDRGKSGWVVVCHVAPKAKAKLPSTLTVTTHQGDVDVPLVTVKSEPFRPE
ncbi:hypothetical protein [Bradyrhizobium sp. JYMT SZCCT0428]|uniref:hypothetical protein n=1 Tax=Bradyrhizobium sp. JYMT SZCCT0428 TaxID=2807673 RepID=UPI001BAACD17|nr:hypothetical protein [Bradyrhizobium sp. JYMT SZCCT0428]MBR1152455.1 hypothetical protein [Bradyrhizobium sp. JYMT SZCCT0428]